ncbi:MAG: hypothetical protein L6R40_008472 [Gallowayella cf. fulva]|nr:MAG: hypothetical protein L6R40_008472 [Xanthomendoza cf. fulva]
MLRVLPQELLDQIEHSFYETTFYPGFLYPLGAPSLHSDPASQEAHNWHHRQKARPLLLCLSKTIKSNYQARMHSENILVFGTGQDPWVYFDALQSFKPDFARCKVELSFGLEDYGEESTQEGLPCQKPSTARYITNGQQIVNYFPSGRNPYRQEPVADHHVVWSWLVNHFGRPGLYSPLCHMTLYLTKSGAKRRLGDLLIKKLDGLGDGSGFGSGKLKTVSAN